MATAKTTYGTIGIKVWIYRGKFGEQVEQQGRRRRRRPPSKVGAKPVSVASGDAVQSKDGRSTAGPDATTAPVESDANQPDSKESS